MSLSMKAMLPLTGWSFPKTNDITTALTTKLVEVVSIKLTRKGFDALSPDLDAFFSSIGTDFDPLLADGEAAESSQLKKASRMCNMGLHLLNEALNASCAEV
ncbi:hypothetical protein F2Q70_00016998 [Brassica cretica]|uniref:Uncharacterized protein n=1 Tax=Brassica cretica TaxID=69181 RepID=A0A8S9HT24_BRACR|nr:hypothetical protein F2Q70_00016998 [Brassica cretica]KAF2600069.1 hypothetical protein F2Q68_00009958 [Brassica cretica]